MTSYPRRQGRQVDDGVSLALPGGAANLMVHHRLDDGGRLTAAYDAMAGVPTPLQGVAHAYFNLSGGQRDGASRPGISGAGDVTITECRKLNIYNILPL